MTRRSAAAPLLLLFVPFLVLSVEGLFATVTDRSWIRKAIGLGRPLDTARSLVETMHLDDEERRRTALLSEGPYATSTDPWIGIEMKRSFHGELVGVPFSTDALGLRTRPGPPPEEGALRILLLGDSVAFGCGVADDESLGAVLEEELRRARPAARPAPVVLTAATLGWTVANARRWLLDHFADVEPDVVLHIVVGNDLDDGFSVLDGGLRSIDHDPVRGADRSPYVGYGFNLGYIGGLRYENRIRDVEHLDHLPVYALYAGITPESKRRWASVFADLEDLERRMHARGGHYVALTVDSTSPFDQVVADLQAAEHPELPFSVLFQRTEASMRLATDPHLCARALAEGGRRLARFLIERGLVEGDVGAISAADQSFADNPVVLPSAEAARAELDRLHALALSDSGPAIDTRGGAGFHQVYGGLWPDGRTAPRVWFVLRSRGERTLHLELESLPAESFATGGRVEVLVDEVPVGKVEIGAEGPFSADLEVPPSTEPFREVVLRSDLWRIGKYRRIDRMESYLLHRAELR